MRQSFSSDHNLKPATGAVALLIGTRKGAFILRGDRARRSWKLSEPMFLGHVAHHLALDPRDGRTLLLAARTGHLGPTVFRSGDFGKSWQEAERPPAFPKAPEGQKGLVLDHVFWLTPGHGTQRRDRPSARCWKKSTAAIPAFAFASSTSRAPSGSTSRYSLTRPRFATCKPQPKQAMWFILFAR
jgi:hypothetical protein